jgi:hypothetical protein
MLLRVEQDKGRKDRHAILLSQLLGCYATGGDSFDAVCCCRAAGCFPAAIRLSRPWACSPALV